MNAKRQITRSDVAVFSIAALLLLTNLAAIGTAGRERAKRAVCLGNLKQLTVAWRQFASDHDGQLVNGMAGIHSSSGAPWVDRNWADNWNSGGQLPEDQQENAIQMGALWTYVGDLKLYRCPSRYAGELLNYNIVDAMNGLSRSGTSTGREGIRIDDTVLWVRNLSEIIKPGADKRMVFIDEGWVAPDSFSTHYRHEAWWDAPPVRHNDGMTASFADGHTEYWQWKGNETVEYGRRNDRALLSFNFAPQTAEGREDLHRLQRAVWGRLGYESTTP